MKKILFLLAFAALLALDCSADTFDSVFKGKTTIKLSGTITDELQHMLDDPANYNFVVLKRHGGISSALPVSETKPGVYTSESMGENIKYTLKNKKFQYKTSYMDLLWIGVVSEEGTLEQEAPSKTSIKCSGSFTNVDPPLLNAYLLQITEFSSKEDFLYRKFALEKVGKNLALKGANNGIKFTVKVTSKGKATFSFSCDERYVRPEFTNAL